MAIVVVSESLPLADGSPAQRRAAGLRGILSRFGAVEWIAIDMDGAQREDRLRADRTTRYLPFAQPTGEGTFATLSAHGALNTPASGNPRFWVSIADRAAFEAGWMNLRRARRVANAIAAAGPELLVVDGVAGAPFASLASRVLYLDRDEAGLHRALSATLADREQGEWHRIVGEGFADRGATLTSDAIRRHPGEIGVAGGPPGEMLDTMREAILLVAGTGLAHIDRPILERVRALAAAGLPSFESALIGTGRAASEAGLRIEQRPGWATLPSYLVRARALYCPFLTTATADLVPLALAAGVPVIAGRSAALRYGLDAQDGVLIAEQPAEVRQLLARLLPQTLDVSAAIAARAARRSEAARNALVATMSAAIGRAPAASEDATIAPRRYSALSKPPLVQFFAATGMLLVSLGLRRGARIDEVRVLDDSGATLTSFLPRSPEGAPASYDVEGGGIVAAVAMRDGIRLELRSEDRIAETIAIAPSDIVTIAAEIVSIERLSTNAMRGLAWITADTLAKTDRIGIRYDGRTLSINSGRARAIGDTGIAAVPFQIFGSGDARGGAPIELLDSIDRLDQRTMTLSRRMVADEETPRADLAALAGSHAGRRGWMIGNGPSVRLKDLDRIPAGDVVFAFNRFYLAHGDTRLREDYIVSADTLMLADFGQEIVDRSSGLPLFCLSRHDPLQAISGRFVPLDAGDMLHPLFSTDPARFVSVGGSSVYVALQMAFFMGIRDIALYGMDFSFAMTPQRHPAYPFPVSFDEGNHFIKGYRSAKPWCPPTWRDIAAAFLNARIFFELNGGRIVNATRGGKLEIFERGDFDALVPQAIEAA